MKQVCCTVLVAIFIITATAWGVKKRPISIEDYYRLQDVNDPQLSPDGKWVAYVASIPDEKKDETLSNLYMVSTAGGDARQITFSGGDEQPRWSPDNRSLAFLSSRDDKEAQIYLLNRTGGEPQRLTDVEQGIDDFAWSPDGKRMLLVMQDPDPEEESKDEKNDEKAPLPYVITRPFFKFDSVGYLKELYNHIYVLNVATRAIKQITFGPYDDAETLQSSFSLPSTPQWSPDGKLILFVSNRTKEPDLNVNLDLFVVPANGGEPRKLTTNVGPDEMPRWSPDGKSIVYITSLEPRYLWSDQTEIAIIASDGTGAPRILTKDLDRNIWNPRFTADGSRITFVLEDAGTQPVASMPTAGGEVRNETRDGVVYDYDIGGNPTTIVYNGVTTDLPGDMFAAASGKTTRLTSVNDTLLNQIEIAKVDRFQFKNPQGKIIDAFLAMPPGFDRTKKYPAIFWMHGGPNAQETGEFDFQTAFLASQGYVIVLISYSGSSGYGKEFQQSIFSKWGNLEVDDLMAGVDAVIKEGYVDPNRIGVGGHSYGAILTNYVITKTNRFKAAITDAGESNFFMNYGVDQYLLDWEIEVGQPWENPDRFREMSPYFQLKNVKTPTMVVCGEKDWNVPLVNSEQLFLSLRRLGVDTMLVVYPNQPHVLTRPSYIKDRLLRYAAWFNHFLQGKPSKIPLKSSTR